MREERPSPGSVSVPLHTHRYIYRNSILSIRSGQGGKAPPCAIHTTIMTHLLVAVVVAIQIKPGHVKYVPDE